MPSMYKELASSRPILSPPGDYVEEAVSFGQPLAAPCDAAVPFEHSDLEPRLHGGFVARRPAI